MANLVFWDEHLTVVVSRDVEYGLIDSFSINMCVVWLGHVPEAMALRMVINFVNNLLCYCVRCLYFCIIFCLIKSVLNVCYCMLLLYVCYFTVIIYILYYKYLYCSCSSCVMVLLGLGLGLGNCRRNTNSTVKGGFDTWFWKEDKLVMMWRKWGCFY